MILFFFFFFFFVQAVGSDLKCCREKSRLVSCVGTGRGMCKRATQVSGAQCECVAVPNNNPCLLYPR
jgi:hypothetical protein